MLRKLMGLWPPMMTKSTTTTTTTEHLDSNEDDEEEVGAVTTSSDAESDESRHSIESCAYIRVRKRAIEVWWRQFVDASPDVTFTSDCVHGSAVVQVHHTHELLLSHLENMIVHAPRCVQDIIFHMPDAFENTRNNESFVAIHFNSHPPRLVTIDTRRTAEEEAAHADDADTQDDDADAMFHRGSLQRTVVNPAWLVKTPMDELRVTALAHNLLRTHTISPLQSNLHDLIAQLHTSGPMLSGNSLEIGLICAQIASLYGTMSPIHLQMHGKLMYDTLKPHLSRIELCIQRLPALSINTLRTLVLARPMAIEDITIDMMEKKIACLVFPVELIIISPYHWSTHDTMTRSSKRQRTSQNVPYAVAANTTFQNTTTGACSPAAGAGAATSSSSAASAITGMHRTNAMMYASSRYEPSLPFSPSPSPPPPLTLAGRSVMAPRLPAPALIATTAPRNHPTHAIESYNPMGASRNVPYIDDSLKRLRTHQDATTKQSRKRGR